MEIVVYLHVLDEVLRLLHSLENVFEVRAPSESPCCSVDNCGVFSKHVQVDSHKYKVAEMK